MKDKIRIGIIGTGQIGKVHLQNYLQVPEAEIVAVADLRQDEAERVAAQYHIAHVYTDYHELLKRDDLDSVDVCLHNRLHMPVTLDALAAGKNVFCEKPMSWKYAEARQMVDAAQAAGRMLYIQLATLFSKETRVAKKLVQAGLLGEIYHSRFIAYRRRGRPWVDGYGTPAFVNTATSGGGAMLDMAVYHISQILYLIGNPKALTVSGVAGQKLDNVYADRRESGHYNVEEFGAGFVRLQGGLTFALEEAWAIQSDNPNHFYIYGSHGGLKVSPLTYYTTLGDVEMDAVANVDDAITRWERCDPLQVYYNDRQRHWVGAQLGRVPLMDTAGIALNTSFITEGIYLSNQLGREVTAEQIEKAI